MQHLLISMSVMMVYKIIYLVYLIMEEIPSILYYDFNGYLKGQLGYHCSYCGYEGTN
jgi:hypothetical protein